MDNQIVYLANIHIAMSCDEVQKTRKTGEQLRAIYNTATRRINSFLKQQETKQSAVCKAKILELSIR